MEEIKQGVRFIVAIMLVVYIPCLGQITKVDYYNKIDNNIFLLSKNKELPFDSIVTYVVKSYSKNEDRVRAYYTWVALNITYDTERLRAMKQDRISMIRKDSSQEAEPVFHKRKAVCEGFSKLMNKFCESSNIPSQMVVGYTETPNGKVIQNILHAWNAVKINDNWQLLDVTWSNGYVGWFGVYYKQFSDKYFIESTADFYKDHLPLDPQWQLSDKPVSKAYFFTSDTVNKYFIKAPFNYKDSISCYKQQKEDDQAWLNYIHYHRYDPQETDYLDAADYFIYNNAAYIFNNGALDFQEYQLFYSKTLLKAKTTANFKKAKIMLESSRNKQIETLTYLTHKNAFSKEVNDRLNILRKNAGNNLITIKKHLEYIEQLQKSAPTLRNKN